MGRRLARIGNPLIPVMLGLAVMAGCGGDSSVSVKQPNPPPPAGPMVNGTVRMPNGQVALQPAWLDRFAALAVKQVLAVTGNTQPVGQGVIVTLVRLDNQGNQIVAAGNNTAPTYPTGQYHLSLPGGYTEETAGGRFQLSVGDDNSNTLTRALVFSTYDAVDVDFASETAVKLILAKARSLRLPLDRFTMDGIRNLVQAVRDLPGTGYGNNVEQMNNDAVTIAAADPTIQDLVNIAANIEPTETPTLLPRVTSTPTNTILMFTPTITPTSPPTSTPPALATPTNTPTPVTPAATATPTNTVAPATVTATNTSMPATATPTNTSAPATATPTNTSAPVTATPTNTGIAATATPTDTGIPVTATPTNTGVSATATPTNTGVSATATPTNTGVPASATPTNTGVPATATPTNTGIAATATPTDTGIPATATPTNTSVPPTATPSATPRQATATPSGTPTPTGPPASIKVVIAPGGGSKGSCRGTCSGGPDAGNPCGQNVDCGTVSAGTPTPSCAGTKACVGGPYNGLACTSSVNCNGCDPDRICTAAGTPLACCTGAAAGSCPAVGSCALVVGSVPVKLPLNGVCLPRSYPPGDVDCSTNVECHTCVGGANDGKTCGKTANDCPSGSCSGNGTCQLAGLSFVPGTENANNEIPLTIPQSSLILNPAVVSGIGAVCVAAGGDGTGLIDCVGGEVNLNATSIHDHNTTPKVCLTGTKTGSTCTKNSDCPSGTCNNTCVNGTKAGSNCTSSADCSGGGTCMGNSMHGPYTAAAPTPGMPDDPTCTSKVKQPDGSMSYACLEQDKQCSGGTNAGAVCTADTDCPGSSCALCNIGATQTCSGGTNAGKSCSTASDCPSGTCVITAKHPGVCNSPSQVVQSGTYAAGDMAIALPLGLTILSSPQANGAPPTDGSWGPDGLPCTGDEPGAASPPVTVLLSTGTNIVYVYDANNIAGTVVTAQVNGHGVSCPNLIGGTVTGMTLGGGFGAVDSTAGDIATIFQFLGQ